MEIIGRAKARSMGLEFYFTGVACKNGETAKRRSSNTRCSCDKCTEQQSRKAKSYNKSYYDANREERIADQKKRDESNPERMALYLASYRAKNAERILSYRSAYHAQNRDRSNQYWAARRSAKMHRTPAWFSDLDEFIMAEANHLVIVRKEATGVDWEVDHMIPLQAKTASGLHVGANIQVMPTFYNRSKRNKMIFTEPFEWISRLTIQAGEL